MCVGAHVSNCRHRPRHLIVLKNRTGTCFLKITIKVTLGQLAGLSKEVCLYAGADWLNLTQQFSLVGWSTCDVRKLKIKNTEMPAHLSFFLNLYPRPKLHPHSPMIYAYGSQSVLPLIGNLSTQIMQKNANTASTFYVVKTDSKLTHGNLLSGETAQKLGILQLAVSSSMQANVTPMNVSEQFPKACAYS